MSRAERLEMIMSGRNNKQLNSKRGGSSNLEKLKNKNIVMIQHSRKVRDKLMNQSVHDRALKTTKHIKNLKMINKRAAKKIRRNKAK